MIEILKTIGNGVVSVLKFLFSALNNGINVIKVLAKLFLWADNYLYLLPSFLAIFAVLFLVIFCLNRVLNGRN